MRAKARCNSITGKTLSYQDALLNSQAIVFIVDFFVTAALICLENRVAVAARERDDSARRRHVQRALGLFRRAMHSVFSGWCGCAQGKALCTADIKKAGRSLLMVQGERCAYAAGAAGCTGG